MGRISAFLFGGAKGRILAAWFFSAALILVADRYPSTIGIAICFLGASIRFWASGYLHKNARLSVGGPYRFTRNPLYLGTLVMALGTAISIEAWWIALAMLVFFAMAYRFTIDFEETFLKESFGSVYLEFQKSVPRFFPSLRPLSRERMLQLNPDAETHLFSWGIAMRNRAYEAYLSFAGLILGVMLVVWVKQNWLLG